MRLYLILGKINVYGLILHLEISTEAFIWVSYQLEQNIYFSKDCQELVNGKAFVTGSDGS